MLVNLANALKKRAQAGLLCRLAQRPVLERPLAKQEELYSNIVPQNFAAFVKVRRAATRAENSISGKLNPGAIYPLGARSAGPKRGATLGQEN